MVDACAAKVQAAAELGREGELAPALAALAELVDPLEHNPRMMVRPTSYALQRRAGPVLKRRRASRASLRLPVTCRSTWSARKGGSAARWRRWKRPPKRRSRRCGAAPLSLSLWHNI